MRKLMLVGVAVLAILVGTQLFMNPEDTLIARLGAIGGEFEKQWIEARTEAVARQTEEIREAAAKVERRNLANQKALEAENLVVQRQVREVSASTWAKQIAVNLSDGMCALMTIGGTLPEHEAKARQYCGASDQIRRDIVEDYPQALSGARSDMMREMTEKFRDSEREMAR